MKALALALHPVRIEAPIPGQSLVGLEVPNQSKVLVSLKEIIQSRKFQARKANTIIALGRDVTGELRSETTGSAASRVAAMPAVRAALIGRQRGFATAPGLVADGRDMGSIVFPDAPLKIFLTASPEERARRRHKQLIEKGLTVNLADLSREIRERDHRDANRSVAPLRAAADAVVIDSTNVGVDDVVAQIEDLARSRIAAIH